MPSDNMGELRNLTERIHEVATDYIEEALVNHYTQSITSRTSQPSPVGAESVSAVAG